MSVLNRSSVSLLKKTLGKSKQSIMGKSMFGGRSGSHGKDFQIGKKFKHSGKGIGKMKSMAPKSSSISPSTEEFTDMLTKATGGSKKGKSSFFGRKKFG